MRQFYIAFLPNPTKYYSIFEPLLSNPETTIFNADAMNNLIFFTDNNIIYLQSIKEKTNPVYYDMGATIISISLDEMIRIIVIGTISTIKVFPYDNKLISLESLYTLTNTWALSYRLYLDPIFYRVIIEFDISTDKESHKIVEWNLLYDQ
jgi:hypothetical protein